MARKDTSRDQVPGHVTNGYPDVRLLEDTGIVTTEKVGRARRCSLGPRRLEDVQEWVELYRRMLDEHLDRFGELIERTTKGEVQ